MDLIASELYEVDQLYLLLDIIKLQIEEKERIWDSGTYNYVDSGIRKVTVTQLQGYWKVNYYGIAVDALDKWDEAW